MANLVTADKQVLGKLFQMSSGYVLNFTDRTFGEFFRDDVGIDIFDQQYAYLSGSKANRLRGFWQKADDILVGKSILKLIEYIENQIFLGILVDTDFQLNHISASKNIAEKLLGVEVKLVNHSVATYLDGDINITLQKEVFDHVKNLLNGGHYFNAVEEAYKIVRQKLKSITGKERAHEAFAAANTELIFGRLPKDEVEKDFFEGVRYLHMSIQNLRNEKAHTPAHELDKNLAIHYIVLASLAYDLISRNDKI